VNGVNPAPFGRQKEADMPIWLALVFIGAIAGFGLVSVLTWATSARTNARCLAAGYPSSRITWRLEGYCTSVEKSVPVSQVP
jgi:hypothetical protein